MFEKNFLKELLLELGLWCEVILNDGLKCLNEREQCAALSVFQNEIEGDLPHDIVQLLAHRKPLAVELFVVIGHFQAGRTRIQRLHLQITADSLALLSLSESMGSGITIETENIPAFQTNKELFWLRSHSSQKV